MAIAGWEGKLRRIGPQANWLRFAYHRSFARANYRQVRRMIRNLVERRDHPRRHISIGLTHRCQNKCEFCATSIYRRDAAGELSTREVEKLLGEIASSRFVFNTVSFMGGECLLRKDIYHLVSIATTLGLCVHISTNGIKLDGESCEMLAQAGLNSVFVAVSPDEPNEARVLRAVQAAQRHDIPCFLSACVRREHVLSGKVANLIDAAKQMGVAGVRLLAVRLSGRWLWESRDKVLSRSEQWELRRLCQSGFAFLTDDACGEAGRVCGARTGSLVYLSPYGEVQPCHFFPMSFGCTREHKLDDILERMWGHPLLEHACDDCLLHEEEFRSQHILSMDAKLQLPMRV